MFSKYKKSGSSDKPVAEAKSNVTEIVMPEAVDAMSTSMRKPIKTRKSAEVRPTGSSDRKSARNVWAKSSWSCTSALLDNLNLGALWNTATEKPTLRQEINAITAESA